MRQSCESRPRSFWLDPTDGLSRALDCAYLAGGAGDLRLQDSGPKRLGGAFTSLAASAWSEPSSLGRRGVRITGATERIALPAGAHPSVAAQSCALWFTAEAIGAASAYFWHAGTATASGLLFARLTTGQIIFQLAGTGTPNNRTTNQTIATGQTRHIAYTWTGDAASGASIKIYIDGVECSYASTSNGISATTVTTTSVIGNHQEPASLARPALGTIYDFCRWRRVLSAQEIRRLATSGPMYGGWVRTHDDEEYYPGITITPVTPRTQLTPYGLPGRRYGSFAGKALATITSKIWPWQHRRSRRVRGAR